MSEKVLKWLEEKIDYEINPPVYELSYKYLDYYYKENDKHIKLSNDDKLKELLEFENSLFTNRGVLNSNSISEKIYFKEMILESNLVQKFYDKKNKLVNLFLEPNSYRYHCNMLFNQILDYCIMNELKDKNDNYLFNKFMRSNFYIFCYENSDKYYYSSDVDYDLRYYEDSKEKEDLLKDVRLIFYNVLVPYLSSSKCEILQKINLNNSFLFLEFFKSINKYYMSLED